MLLNVSQRSALTLQEQIIGQIRARILRGEMEPDQSLPSIRELSKTLRVAVNTVQRAYDLLLREELIYVRQGKGFFVAPLKQSDKSEVASQRFKESLQKLMEDARREGLSDSLLKKIFIQLHGGAKDGDA